MTDDPTAVRAASGPAADGPVADGPAADGPAARGPIDRHAIARATRPVTTNAGRHGPTIVKHIDGKRTWREIFDMVRASGVSASDDEFFKDLAPVYDVLNAIDRVLLRSK